MPDATGLELLAKELGSPVLETVYFRNRATLVIDPAAVREVLGGLRGRGYGFLASVHGVDYHPEEPRLGDREAARRAREPRGRLGDTGMADGRPPGA